VIETSLHLRHIKAMHIIITIVFAVIVGLVSYLVSVTQTKRTLATQSKPLNNPALEKHFMRLANALDLKRLHVNIYEIDPVNGLAAPDGQIYITRGFLDRFNNGEVSAAEMSSVIAHELGHVALGHTKRRMIDFSGQNAVRTVLTVTLNRFIPFIGPWIANMAVNMVAAGMSRKDEFEADSYATALMIKAGLGVAPQKSLFTKLNKLTANSGSAPAWFLSHPKTIDRIKAIEANEIRWTGFIS
tara:strand:- start:1993 stop:2721 length:729 start_codon:yes stop_codon:yes gene_type:complete